MRELVVIDGVAIEGSLLTRKFCCNLLKCKGACCSLPGGRGAPLQDEEIEEIRSALPEVLPLLSLEKRRAIDTSGFFEGVQGDYATTCIDDKDCVFVFREKGIAKCALEKAFNDGKTEFRKPISCHLYPVRVNRFGPRTGTGRADSTKDDVLRYHEISECRPAVEKGEAENIGVVEFLKPALARRYGEVWYNKLESYSNLMPVPAGNDSRRGSGRSDDK